MASDRDEQRPTGEASEPGVRANARALHDRLRSELAMAGDWWDASARQAIMAEARAARGCRVCAGRREQIGADNAVRHAGSDRLPAAAVEVVHRVVIDSGRLTRTWAQARVDELGAAPYAEVVGVTAMLVALDVYARSIGDAPYALLPPAEGSPARQLPDGVGEIGAWIPMTEEKLLANVTRALSLVPLTNATWRTLVTESYSRGPQMLELTWDRALTRPQVELVASHVSRLQECFY